MTRYRCRLLVTLIGVSAIAACSSSTTTAPSTASLTRVFDSLYVMDSAAHGPGDLRAIGEKYLALFADEGLAPISVAIHTDGGTLLLKMMAAESYDTTAAGLPADSLWLVIGWTSDYSKYAVLLGQVFASNGPRVRRIGATAARLAALAATRPTAHHTTHAARAITELQPLAFLVNGDATRVADSITGNLSSVPDSRTCSWQHVVVSSFTADSILACSRVAVALEFALHVAGETGRDTALTHVSMSAELIPGVRLVGFNGF